MPPRSVLHRRPRSDSSRVMARILLLEHHPVEHWNDRRRDDCAGQCTHGEPEEEPAVNGKRHGRLDGTARDAREASNRAARIETDPHPKKPGTHDDTA